MKRLVKMRREQAELFSEGVRAYQRLAGYANNGLGEI